MQSNQLNAVVYEFGIAVRGTISAAMLEQWCAGGFVPRLLQDSLREQIERIAQLKAQERQLTRRIEQHNATDELALRLLSAPGIGTLTASAVAAELGEGAHGYASGRHYAACKGMVPRMNGTGGKLRAGKISKRGEPYVRTLFVHGARSVITAQRKARRLSPWLAALLARRPFNVAVTALANKMARTAWAIAAHGGSYQPNHAVSPARELTVL
jgi:transposase